MNNGVFHPADGCQMYEEQLEDLFSWPNITSIKPHIIYSDIPTIISMYGDHLDSHTSEYVYNTITAVRLNQHLECTINDKNFTYLSCIVDAVGNNSKSKFSMCIRNV